MNRQIVDAVKMIQSAASQAAAFSRLNVDAMMIAGQVVSQGAEQVGQELAAFTRGTVDQGMAAGKAVMAAKTLNEVIAVQSSFMKTSANAGYAEAVRLSKFSAQVANQAAAPIKARLEAAAEVLKQPLAA